MSFLFDNLELDYQNFQLKFGGTIVLAQTAEGAEPMPIRVEDTSKDRYSFHYMKDNKVVRGLSSYFNLVRQLPESLGYVNASDGGIAFARLKGARQQKQGLCHDRCSWAVTKDYPHWEDLFAYYLPHLYPSLEQATWEIMSGKNNIVALSCNFALDEIGSIIFNNNIIIGNYINDIVIYDDELLELWNKEINHG